MAYFVNWGIYGRNYQPQQIPASKLTHVLYAFANIRSDGTVYLTDTWADVEKHYGSDSWTDTGNNLYGCIKQLYLLKKTHRHLKILLSIGGWSYSSNFAQPASTEQGRQRFASTAATLVGDLGFDGIDIDWEYPQDSTEAKNFVELLAESKKQLQGRLLSIACPAGPDRYQVLDLAAMNAHVDLWNLMAYDYSGTSSSGITGHHANLYSSTAHPKATPFNTDQAIRYYISHGVPSHKINLGIPLYGRAFVGTTGIGSAYSSKGAGSWEPGIWDYNVLPPADAGVTLDVEAGATYSFDASKATVISFDDKQSALKKSDYIINQSLGGAFFWEASGDRNDTGSLIQIVHDKLYSEGGSSGDQNTLTYPNSTYDNLRMGMPA